MKYPHLFLIGEAGSGKSTTLERVILPIFGRSRVVAAPQVTGFTLMKDAASSNLFHGTGRIQAVEDRKEPAGGAVQSLPRQLRRARGRAWARRSDTGDLRAAGPAGGGRRGIAGRTGYPRARYGTVVQQARPERPGGAAGVWQAFGDAGRADGDGPGAARYGADAEHRDRAAMFDEALPLFNGRLPSRVVNNLASCMAGLRLTDAMCNRLGLSWGQVFPWAWTPARSIWNMRRGNTCWTAARATKAWWSRRWRSWTGWAERGRVPQVRRPT